MAKAEYSLAPNESIIMKSELVYCGKTSGELILTNLYLVHITAKGTFKTTYTTQRYPVNQIKVFNGKAQALLGKSGDVDIYFINGQVSFTFSNNETLFSEKKAEQEAAKWVNAINQLITGENVEVNVSAKTAIPGTEMIAGALGGTVDAFKGALGFKSNKPASTELNEKVAIKCISCGASVSGNKGRVVRCSYCDTDQQL